MGSCARAMSRFTLRVDVSTLRVRENEHWLGRTCFHARTVRKFDHGICRLCCFRGETDNVSVVRSAFKEHNEYAFTSISKSNYRGNKNLSRVLFLLFFLNFFLIC